MYSYIAKFTFTTVLVCMYVYNYINGYTYCRVQMIIDGITVAQYINLKHGIYFVIISFLFNMQIFLHLLFSHVTVYTQNNFAPVFVASCSMRRRAELIGLSLYSRHKCKDFQPNKTFLKPKMGFRLMLLRRVRAQTSQKVF